MKVSYECEELIEEIKNDIIEFGPEQEAWGVWKKMHGFDVLVNYLLGHDQPSDAEKEGGVAEKYKLSELLAILEEQNRII